MKGQTNPQAERAAAEQMSLRAQFFILRGGHLHTHTGVASIRRCPPPVCRSAVVKLLVALSADVILHGPQPWGHGLRHLAPRFPAPSEAHPARLLSITALPLFCPASCSAGPTSEGPCLCSPLPASSPDPLFSWLACECSIVSDSETPWTAAHQVPLSMGFFRQDD